MSNKSEGNNFERIFCETLFKYGFWVHNMAQNKAGQPADIIAVKNKKAYLIDCKECKNNIFPFSRIESNQHTAMKLWKYSGNGHGVFALRLNDGRIYMIAHDLMIALSINQSSMGENLISHYGTPLESWVELCST